LKCKVYGITYREKADKSKNNWDIISLCFHKMNSKVYIYKNIE
jgi:hypothetical protein